MTQGCIASDLVDLCARKGVKVAVAESCTGGGVGAAITSAPGASEVLPGGVVSYSNGAKEKVLGVRAETLARFGAVSEECAREMAEGARGLFGADVAVSVTGVAGPSGGSAEKPVGLVCFGLSTRERVSSESVRFGGGRDDVRAGAVAHALGLLSKAALSVDKEAP